MVVISRADSGSTDDTALSTTRPPVAVSTAIGMVLGVMCLFVMVVSYQFLIPRIGNRKPKSTHAKLAPPEFLVQPKPTLLQHTLSQISKIFTLIFNSRERKPCKPTEVGEKPRTKHRILRSLHLPSSPNHIHATPNREQIKEKFSTTLRLNIRVPNVPARLRNTLSSPRTPKRKFYSQIHDNGFDDPDQLTPLTPSTALLSPWSPAEDQYPDMYSDFSEVQLFARGQEEPITPPVQAYLPETPLRNRGVTIIGREIQYPLDARVHDPFRQSDPFIEEPIVDMDTMIALGGCLDVKGLARKGRKEGDFVISNDEDWDSDSDSLYSNISGPGLT
ncbi:hypothetical protein C8Q75DRAFT_783009 [Abortiporus biennis]|nr:hypothetical protein C8Q75DRAFT_783009 [Abortiporus biennis]